MVCTDIDEDLYTFKPTVNQWSTLHDTSMINPRHSIPKPQIISSNTSFNGSFGIPFQDESYIIHIRAPQPSEILTLYNLHNLIPLYLSILSESIIRRLVLHILPSCLVQELATISHFPI